jgi:hypothetical protein
MARAIASAALTRIVTRSRDLDERHGRCTRVRTRWLSLYMQLRYKTYKW